MGRKIRDRTALPPVRCSSSSSFSIRSIAIFATVALAQSLMSRAGAYPLTHVALQWGSVWFWPSLVLMIVGHDAYYYWTHRAMHDPRLFKAFHGRHHPQQQSLAVHGL